MKRFRGLLAATFLVLTMSCAALAGDIQTGGSPAPPPPPATQIADPVPQGLSLWDSLTIDLLCRLF